MSTHSCEHDIDASALADRQRQVLVIVLVINLAALGVMIIGGILSGSSALLSGTLDNLGDSLTYALSLMVVGASMTTKARVAVFKGILILAAALFLAGQILWRINNMDVPVVQTMGLAAIINFVANLVCLRLLFPFKQDDVNMESMWECSRNDVYDGLAVITATVAVWIFQSGWPDVLIAGALLILFLRSATRVLRRALRQLQAESVPG